MRSSSGPAVVASIGILVLYWAAMGFGLVKGEEKVDISTVVTLIFVWGMTFAAAHPSKSETSMDEAVILALGLVIGGPIFLFVFNEGIPFVLLGLVVSILPAKLLGVAVGRIERGR